MVGYSRKLVVMRHAKAEPYAETDSARRLTARGWDEAVAAGNHLASLGIRPDHALVSSAARTRETWDAVREACAAEAHEEITDALFAASPAAVLETVQLLPDDTSTAIYVGHNPTAQHLAASLDDGEADPEVLGGLLAGFSTSAFAVFEVSEAWRELSEGGARLVHFYAGRG